MSHDEELLTEARTATEAGTPTEAGTATEAAIEAGTATEAAIEAGTATEAAIEAGTAAEAATEAGTAEAATQGGIEAASPIATEGAPPAGADPSATQVAEPVPAAEAPQPHTLPIGDEAPTGEGAPATAHRERAGTAHPPTVGAAVAGALRAAGVKYAFTVPGESFLGLLEALDGAGIRVVATRHESAAAFMAEAHGQLTGRPAACLATRAVGASNLAIGIHTARQDSTPMFALVGQVRREHRGREAFQEVDLVETIGGLAKWAVEIGAPPDVDATMREATRRAVSGRPGPVLVSLPEDLLDEPLPEASTASPGPLRDQPVRPDPADVRAVLQLLASAERPVILAGGGVLRARTSSDLVRLAELLHVPVMGSWRRGDVFPNDHPLYLGMTGYGAPATVRERLATADAVLVIGCRLSEVASFGYAVPRPGVPWAHVDLEPARPDGLPAADRSIAADARAFIRASVQRLGGAVLDAERVRARQAANERDRAAFEAASNVTRGSWSGPGVHPGRVVETLRRVLPDEAIVTTDAGNFSGWVARGFRFRRPGTFIGPTSGAMGYGLPAAIAAAFVHRDRPVVALCGDGGLAMSMAELETAVREHARVIVVCFDNERYGTIRMHQDLRAAAERAATPGAPGATAATDLGPIDFAAIARACGARGVRVETDDAFEPALRQALASDRPSVLHLALDRAWVSVDRDPGADGS